MPSVKDASTSRTEWNDLPTAAEPLVTIIIVNCNYGRFIEPCLMSVARQDYPNIECIVVDCASSDNSRAVIESTMAGLPSSRFRVRHRDVNGGHLPNALSALSDVRGAFLVCLDSDDLLFPSFVATHLAAHMASGVSAPLSVTDQIQIDAEGQMLAGTCHWHQKWHELASPDPTSSCRARYVPPDWNSWAMEHWIWGSTSSIMFQTRVAKALAPAVGDHDGFPAHVGIDSYYARLAHCLGGTLLIDRAEGAYRRHGSNTWSNNGVLGGQAASGRFDRADLFNATLAVARKTLADRRDDIAQEFGDRRCAAAERQLRHTGEIPGPSPRAAGLELQA